MPIVEHLTTTHGILSVESDEKGTLRFVRSNDYTGSQLDYIRDRAALIANLPKVETTEVLGTTIHYD